MESLDLNIATYSLDDLYCLFHLDSDTELTEADMKAAKRFTLKSHPDKSGLDAKYFLFFSQAYKRLHSIYSSTHRFLENREMSLQRDTQNMEDTDKTQLSRFFRKNPQLKKDASQFNAWFNREFIQCSDPMYTAEQGHGDWFKSNQDIPDTQISKDTFQDYKRQIIMDKPQHQLTTFKSPFGETWSDGNSALGASMLLGDPNQTEFSTTQNGYGSDLKQAYSESVFAVSEDVGKEHLHASVQAYRHGRDRMDTTPLEKQEAERILYQQERQNVHDGMERANYYANQRDTTHVKKELFWSKMKRLK
jgi:hypothetical protein